MERYICIHGHFYQPPRENPWLEDVELQDSAYPHHDWNARITEECYKQNAASRILAPDRKIIDIVSNYANMSFDFGPTLLYWLAAHAPEVYDSIVRADEMSRERFSGHGAAMAQAYNHIILPLANTRDKHTQVIWGIRDFESRFGRKPEGMWLPETAVDTETLEVLAEHGITFTILAPRQARQVRKIGAKTWNKVDENSLVTTMPYVCNLPSRRQMNLFFYHGPISHDVAYGGLLHSGENFAARLMEGFAENSEQASLVHIATDGESFGHHHYRGDMALAYCLHHTEANHLANITVYGEYLEKFPPTHEVRIWDNSSWSCIHGVERWKNNCGCCADQARCGQQQWRAPLREAMDWLRDRLAQIYEARMSGYHPDPWQLRNDYVSVINDRSAENVGRFMSDAAGKELGYEEKVAFLKLMEMQRNAMLMYTSCGWFFDNISGIETVQVMQYASRAMQLCREVEKVDLEPEFKDMLQEAPTNTEQFRSGKEVYEAYVEPARLDLNRVAGHFALSSLFEEYPHDGTDIYCYSAEMEDYERVDAGIQSLATARATVQSNMTLEKDSHDLAVLHLGDHNLFAALGPRMDDNDFQNMREDIATAFRKGDSNEVMKLMNAGFDGNNFSLWHLFKDEQRRILYELLGNTWQEIEGIFRQIYDRNYAIMSMIRNIHMPLPKALSTPAEFVLNLDLRRVIQAEEVDVAQLQDLAEEVSRLSLKLDETTVRFEAAARIDRLVKELMESPQNTDLLRTVERSIAVLSTIISDMDLQSAQNVLLTIAKEKYPEIKDRAESGYEDAQEWVGLFESLADRLALVIPSFSVAT
jgi:alpha-amylase/alpha-mannosidase (GH57 family)